MIFIGVLIYSTRKKYICYDSEVDSDIDRRLFPTDSRQPLLRSKSNSMNVNTNDPELSPLSDSDPNSDTDTSSIGIRIC